MLTRLSCDIMESTTYNRILQEIQLKYPEAVFIEDAGWLEVCVPRGILLDGTPGRDYTISPSGDNMIIRIKVPDLQP